ncbi:LPP20 family lipoprotein [Sulfurimonas sp. HSL-1716]|uniref:LPP20 family lipoprotein n=1 Tax=Hydrocurvibacter sulfurireducens TaxID=3131937 RepID=UPI0031F78763
MKYSLILAALLFTSSVYAEDVAAAQNTEVKTVEPAPMVSTPPSTTNVTCNCNNRDEAKKEETVSPKKAVANTAEQELTPTHDIRISVTGEGVAPMNTSSPAQAYALAKRAAVADAYRMIAEKVKGVRVEGYDLIKNMMVKRSTVRTSVDAMVRNANIVETNFKEGLCEVEMEILISYSQFAH